MHSAPGQLNASTFCCSSTSAYFSEKCLDVLLTMRASVCSARVVFVLFLNKICLRALSQSTFIASYQRPTDACSIQAQFSTLSNNTRTFCTRVWCAIRFKAGSSVFDLEQSRVHSSQFHQSTKKSCEKRKRCGKVQKAMKQLASCASRKIDSEGCLN